MSNNVTYVKNIKPYGGHEVGRIYHVCQYSDGTHYSCDSRGTGQGGYISNVINSYFEPSTKEAYEKQNERDKINSMNIDEAAEKIAYIFCRHKAGYNHYDVAELIKSETVKQYLFEQFKAKQEEVIRVKVGIDKIGNYILTNSNGDTFTINPKYKEAFGDFIFDEFRTLQKQTV